MFHAVVMQLFKTSPVLTLPVRLTCVRSLIENMLKDDSTDYITFFHVFVDRVQMLFCATELSNVHSSS